MNFFKRILSKKETTTATQPIVVQKNTALEHTFVQHFLNNGGKFIYCTTKAEISDTLNNICHENNWTILNCNSEKLIKIAIPLSIVIDNDITKGNPILIECEYLISDNGSILFSSKQLKDHKIYNLNEDFIVFAKISQLVKNRRESLTGIKTKYKKNLPTNISAINKYTAQNLEDNFMNYGNSNAKNLYLLLLEDL